MLQELKAWKYKKRSLLVLLVAILIWSISLGWGMATAIANDDNPKAAIATQKAVDPISDRYQLGHELYLEKCSSCHLAIPPAVFPTETWREILQQPQEHYGTQLKPIIGPSLLLMWDYIRTYSRPLNEDEEIPYRVADSRYFKALHPKVEFPSQASIKTCISCHPSANQFNYRRLSSEWQE